ncbi:MAG: hypothetical protein E6Q97_04430 [Desulfurellales bacterium]|nr:MAG: hypothetical protein E6Q97_04430 [Desulfurellales bacterium]
MHLIGLDIAFVNTGVVSVHVDENNQVLLNSCYVIETEKNQTSEKVSSTLDNVRRAQIIHEGLRETLDEVRPVAVIVESMSWPRNAASAIKMAMAWGAIAPLLKNYPVIEVSPQDIKLLATGKRSATKQEVERGVLNLLPSSAWARDVVETHVQKASLREHCYDALGAVLAAQRTEKYRLLRAARRA